MRYWVLGPVEVADAHGDPAPVVGSRQRALLAALLAHPGRVVSAERLAESLWGTMQPTDPTAALQSQVSRLRRRLGGVGRETAGRGYWLQPAPGELDAAVFEQLVAEARAMTHPSQAMRLLEEALSLWRGAAYQDCVDDPDVRIAADRLEELRNNAREQRAAVLLALGRSEEAAEQAAGLVREFPLREKAVEVLVEAWYAAGWSSEALTAYESYRARLAEELGLDPGEELRRLHLRVLRGEQTVAGARAALPRPVTSYVRSDDEVQAVSEAVRTGRQVTLTGPGGVGKTRLAVEVAARLAGDFPRPVTTRSASLCLPPTAHWPAATPATTQPERLPTRCAPWPRRPEPRCSSPGPTSSPAKYASTDPRTRRSCTYGLQPRSRVASVTGSPPVLRHCPPHRFEVRLGDPLGVLADLAELVEQWHQIGSWNPTWVTIRLCVDVFVRLGEHQVAGQLLGAMEASTTAGPIYGADADRLASAEASLRSQLGDATYDALTARGAALADADAIALTRRALSDLMQSTT